MVISARERSTPGSEISRDSTAVVLSAATGEVRWVKERFIPYALNGGVIAGTTPKPDGSQEQNRVEALNARTGNVVWKFEGFNIDRGDTFGHHVGPGLVQINTRDTTRQTHLLDIATGRSVLRLDSPREAYDCLHDQAKLVICHTDYPAAIAAYDATTLHRLWTLDENTPGRRVPEVLFAYHGAIYVGLGGTTLVPDTGATLDGLTGKDLDVDLQLVPHRAGPGYILTYDDGLRLYRAIG